MHFVPKQKKMTVVNLLVAAFFILGIVLLSSAVILREIGNVAAGSVLGLGGALGIIGAAFVFARYRITVFSYVVRLRDDRDYTGLGTVYTGLFDAPYFLMDLAIHKTVGKGEPVPQCVLSLGDLKESLGGERKNDVVRVLRKKYEAENGGRIVVYDYTVTPGKTDVIGLVFLDGREYVGVLLEADEALFAFFENIK